MQDQAAAAWLYAQEAAKGERSQVGFTITTIQA